MDSFEQIASRMLQEKDVQPTELRVAVLTCLLQNAGPSPAQDILEKIRATRTINKVTLYRILDLLVEQQLALRHSSGERSFRYCALPHSHKDGPCMHCHFHCTRCGAMQCIDSREIPMDCKRLVAAMPMRVESVEIRLDGLCQACEHQSLPMTPQNTPHP